VQRRIALPLVALEQVVRKVRARDGHGNLEVPGSMPPPCGAATATFTALSHNRNGERIGGSAALNACEVEVPITHDSTNHPKDY